MELEKSGTKFLRRLDLETKIYTFNDQVSLLGHKGLGYTELRVPGKLQEFYSSSEDFIAVVANGTLSGGNVYVSINPRKTQDGKTASVNYLTCLVIDIDPVRTPGTASSNEAHESALSQARKLLLEYSNATCVDSGNGAHIYFPLTPREITPENRKELEQRIKLWMEGIRKKYQTLELKIDHIHDLARMIRVWGSVNEKSGRICQVVGSLNTNHRFDPDSLLPNVPIVRTEVKTANKELSRFGRFIANNREANAMMEGAKTFPSRSEADFYFIRLLTIANFTLNEIKEFATLNPLGRGNELKDQDVERVYSKIRSDPSSGLSSISDSYFDNLHNRRPGLFTGFSKLDQMTAGLKPGRLYVLAARPTEGKTSFLSQLSLNLSRRGHNVLFFPTEVGASNIYDKIVSQETGVNLRKFQFGDFTAEETAKIKETRKSIESLSLMVAEDFALVSHKIEEKIRETAPDVVIVDFLNSMNHPEGGTPGELTKDIVAIKSFAGKFEVPIILAAQLSRKAINNEASLADLKGSGTIEEQGDDIWFIHTLDKLAYPRPVNLLVMKSKYGECGVLKMKFHSSICKFEEV